MLYWWLRLDTSRFRKKNASFFPHSHIDPTSTHTGSPLLTRPNPAIASAHISVVLPRQSC